MRGHPLEAVVSAFRALILIAIGFLAVVSTSHAQKPDSVISVEEVRTVLGVTPVAIPGYPVTFRRLWVKGRSVIVEQTIDSGRVVQFREDPDRPGRFHGSVTATGQGDMTVATFAARQRCRRLGEVFACVLNSGALKQTQVAQLLDRLAPMP